MLLSVMSAATLAVSPLPSGQVSGEFLGHIRRNAAQTLWERYDLRLTNHGADPKNLSFCPRDAKLLVYRTPFHGVQEIYHRLFFARGGARSAPTTEPFHVPSFASAFEGESWSFNCSQLAIAPGESAEVSFYFRWLSPRRGGSPLLVDTSLGKLVVLDGKVTLVEEGGEAD